MWSVISQGFGIFSLLLKYWLTSKSDKQAKKAALLAYQEARERYAAGRSAKLYRESQKQKKELSSESPPQ